MDDVKHWSKVEYLHQSVTNPNIHVRGEHSYYSDAWTGDFQTSVGGLGEDLTKQIGTRNPADERIFIRADQNTRYGDFMQVMNALQDSGFYSVALVGEDQATQ